MRLHRDMMRVLVTEIVDGTRGSGERLPREVDLAEQFRVSRGVTRESIRALEERGVLEVRHGRGATVRAPEEWDLFDPDIIAALLEGPAAVDMLAQYLECRRIFEVEAAGLAAERTGEAQLALLRERYGELEQAVLEPSARDAEGAFHRADVAFHQALIDAGGNRALGTLARRIHDALLVAGYPLATPAYRRDRALPEHRAILEAVAAGDPAGARSAMERHLAAVQGYLDQHAKRIAKRR